MPNSFQIPRNNPKKTLILIVPTLCGKLATWFPKSNWDCFPFSVMTAVRFLTLKGVVFYTAESGRCLLYSGTGDQAIPAEKTQ